MNANIAFTKMHGTGNDFVVLNGFRHALPPNFDFAAFARETCERHRGIGADGLLLLCEPDDLARQNGAQIRMRMWNPDGSEDMCGNGLRCVARLVFESGVVAGESFAGGSFVAQTLAGLRRCEIIGDDVRVEMGKPNCDFSEIPFAPTPHIESNIEYSISWKDTILLHVTTLSTGSAHTIVFVNELPDDATFETLSPQIEHHAWFPRRTSVMWAQMLDRQNVRLRIWERGVADTQSGTTGETLACGTGACATAVAAQITGRGDEIIRVHSRGGTLKIGWKAGENIQMTGGATIVYEGQIINS